MELFLLATRRGRQSAKRDDRGTIQAAWILIAGGCIAGFLLSTLFPTLNWPHNVMIVLLGDFLLVAGIFVRIWAVRHLGKLFTVDVGIQPGHHVVQDGPFRFVRHPSYSGSLLAWIGVGLLTRNWLGFFVIVICTFIAYVLRISVEEKVLREKFGTEYEKYAARTKKMVPGVY